jgi:hypothetical protein
MKQINRQMLFCALDQIGRDTVFDVDQVCTILDATTPQVKGVMAWCIKSGVIRHAGTRQKRDKTGRVYSNYTYKWTGAKRAKALEPMDPALRWLRGAPLPL